MSLRLGVIGAGSVVREIYQYLYFKSEYAEDLELVAVCDPNEKQLDWFGSLGEIPAKRRFKDYREMIETVEMDAVAVNTPDSLHADPTISCLEAGIDVLLPKPLAASITDAHAIMEGARRTGRMVGVDFHKRDDPLTKEARTRIGEGLYGRVQSAVWYMVDQLSVADPNHEPRFFASPDFAEKNSPVTFLTVHMADTFFHITGARPTRIRATGFKQKMPSLSPISVDGYDLVDTEILTDTGCLCHIITGWAIPNTAHALTVQSARIIGSEGLLDLALDSLGYHEITHERLQSRNTSFRTFEADGTVSGFGMSNPGKLLRRIARYQEGAIDHEGIEETRTPAAMGFWPTVVCEAAHVSLQKGTEIAAGVFDGHVVDVGELLTDRLGEDAEAYLR